VQEEGAVAAGTCLMAGAELWRVKIFMFVVIAPEIVFSPTITLKISFA
jgi:hypothetical protein